MVLLFFCFISMGRGIFISRYRLSNIGKAISNVSRIWDVQETRTQTMGPQHLEKITKERGRDHGRDREHEPRMVETLARIRLSNARRNGPRRTDQEERGRKIRAN